VNKDHSLRNPHLPILIGLIASALLISIPAGLSIRANRQLGNSFHWVQHTLDVKRQTERLLSLLVDAETGERGFLLSKRDYYLEPYWAALKQLPSQIHDLQDLTSDNQVQQENVHALSPLITTKLEVMARNISLSQSGKGEGADAIPLGDRGKQVMDAIRARLVLIDSEETRLLASREESLSSNFKQNSALLFGIILLNGAFAGVMLKIFHRLQNIRNLVTVCAWSHKVEYQNEWMPFEEYLKRRFKINCSHGISPAEFARMFPDLEEEPQQSSGKV